MKRWFCGAAFGCAIVFGCAFVARAHVQLVSYCTLQEETSEHETTVLLKVSDFVLSSVDAVGAGNRDTVNTSLRDYFFEHLDLRSQEGTICTPRPESFAELSADRGWRRFRWSFDCKARAVWLDSELFDELPGHFLIVNREKAGVAQAVCTSTARNPICDLTMADEETRSASPHAAQILELGAEHILGGWDHVLFVVLLIAVATRLRDVALAATGFTLGHSMTLALASLGWVEVIQSVSEMLIAASIVVVALENFGVVVDRSKLWLRWVIIAACVAGAYLLWQPALLGVGLGSAGYFVWTQQAQRPIEGRVFVAALFGLVHGLGFSSVFRSGVLSDSATLVPLALFNLGVELGQIGIILCTWPALQWLRRKQFHTSVVASVSIVAIGLGTYFVVSNGMHPAP